MKLFANAFVKFHYLDAEGFSTSERRAMSLMYASNFIAHPDTSSMSTFAEARVSFYLNYKTSIDGIMINQTRGGTRAICN